jgi:MerR family transcriptional regulator, light-induced transcriptional regulator
MPSKYSIKDLERLSGIKAHTLRIWEQRYDILRPERSETNIRYYSNSDLKRILNISLLNNNGHKISKIAALNDEEIVKEVEKLLNNYNKESDQIENLVLCLMDFNEERFDKTITNSVIHFGFENTMEKIVFPFLKHLGNMWQVGMINPSQEHFLSNLIRQKLIVGIDGLMPNPINEPKNCLLFLPSNELHEIGLLYINFILKRKGHKCYYLGQSVPIEDLATISRIVNPDYCITIFTSKLQETTLDGYLRMLSVELPEAKFLLSGRMMFEGGEDYELPKRFSLFEDYTDFKKQLEAI